jgi:hypothetical protein
VRTHDAGTGAWVLDVGDSHQQTLAARVIDWLRLAHLNFHRVYPWILLGPYVALLGSYFVLDRKRLGLTLVVHAAGCAAFVAASQAINTRTSTTAARIVIINARSDTRPLQDTNSPSIEGAEQLGAVAPGQRITQNIEVRQWSLPGDLEADRLFGLARSSGQATGGVWFGEHPKGWAPEPGLTNAFGSKLAFKPPPTGLANVRPLSMLLDLLAYAAVLGVSHSFHFYRRYREREHRALVLESNLATARLNALRAQLQPHFLFNSLNAIATLLRRDPRLAENTLMSLSELLRLALSQSEKQEVPLREEMEFVHRYLEIQQTRFGEKLRFEQEIDPAALDCLVPTLLLQPLIENAIRHGIEPSENAGLVRLTTARLEGKLVLTVEDDGVGLSGAPITNYQLPITNDKFPPLDTRHPTLVTPHSGGIGLANVRARLEALYGAAQKIELDARPEGGVRVRIEIPWRLATQLKQAGAVAQ